METNVGPDKEKENTACIPIENEQSVYIEWRIT